MGRNRRAPGSWAGGRRWARSALAVAVALAGLVVAAGPGGCAGDRRGRDYGPHFVSEESGAAVLFRDPIAEQYPAAPALLSGFDQLRQESGLRVGDRVLVAVELTEGAEQRAVRTWFVRAEVVGFEPWQWQRKVEATIDGIGTIELYSNLAQVRIELFDDTGARLGRAETKIAENFLSAGIFQASQTALLHRLTAGLEGGSFWPFEGPVSMSMSTGWRRGSGDAEGDPGAETASPGSGEGEQEAQRIASTDAVEGDDRSSSAGESEGWARGRRDMGGLPAVRLNLTGDIQADDPRIQTAIDVIQGSLSVAAVAEALEEQELFKNLRSAIIAHCFRKMVFLELLLNIAAGGGPLWSVGFDYVLPLVDPLDAAANGFERLQGYEVPLEFEFNGVLLMSSRLVVVESQRPLSLTGGLLALDAFHPHRPDHRLQVRVIAARSGGGISRDRSDRLGREDLLPVRFRR